MKTSLYVALIFVITLSSQQLSGQDCEVKITSLKGSYEGECKNGKAEGNGKATGLDQYDGEFKSGMPHGLGKYTWQNGEAYTGKWVKGYREGPGKLLMKTNGGADSLQEGFWKKDLYIGKYEFPFKLIRNTVHITSTSIRKLNTSLNQVDIFLDSETGKQLVGFSGATPAPVITDITIIEGSYQKLVQNPNLGKKVSYSLEDVVFPLRAVFTIDTDLIEIVINEPGKWLIESRMSF